MVRMMSNLPKLPEITEIEIEILAAIKRARAKAVPISEAEANEIRKTCRPHLLPELQIRGAVVLMRRGKIVWRIPGKAGANLDRPPIAVAIARMNQRHSSTLNKIARESELMIANRERKGVKARQLKAEENKVEVFKLAENHPNRTDLIAKNAKMTRRNVQLILKNKTK